MDRFAQGIESPPRAKLDGATPSGDPLSWLAAFASIGCSSKEPRPPFDGLLDSRALGVGATPGLARDPGETLETEIPAPFPFDPAELLTERHRGYAKRWLRHPDGRMFAVGYDPPGPPTAEAVKAFLLAWSPRKEMQAERGGYERDELLGGSLVWQLRPLRQLVDGAGDRWGDFLLSQLQPVPEVIRVEEVERVCPHGGGTPCQQCALVGLGVVRDLARTVLEKVREESQGLLRARSLERRIFLGSVLKTILATCVGSSPYLAVASRTDCRPDTPGSSVASAFMRLARADQQSGRPSEERMFDASDPILLHAADEISYWRAWVSLTFSGQRMPGHPLTPMYVGHAFPGLVWAALLNVFSSPDAWALLRCCRWCGRFWTAPQRQGPGRPRKDFCSKECAKKFHDRGSGESPR